MDSYKFFIVDLPGEQMQIFATPATGSTELTIIGPEPPAMPVGETLSGCEFAAAMDKLQERGFEVIVGSEQKTPGLVGPHRMPSTVKVAR